MKIKEAFPPLSLRTKLVLSYVFVTLGAILILAIAVTLAVKNYFAYSLQDQLQQDGASLAQQIGTEYYTNKESWNGLPSITLRPHTYVLVVDKTAHIVGRTPTPFVPTDSQALTQALTQALQGQQTLGHLTNAGNKINDYSMYICLPVRDNGASSAPVIGALLLVEPEQYGRGSPPGDFLLNVNQAILLTGIMVGLAVILISLALARSLTNPLVSLTHAAENMRGGNYTQRVIPPRSQDEMEKLAIAFNAMAERIEADVNALLGQEQLRRDMIANIAHDLITPLSAIQGYSEALADDLISEPKERQETAQLIGREVQRLRRLVSDMQQMSTLESGRVRLDLAPLDLWELVNETVEVITPECEQTQISVRNEIAPTTPMVLADGDRIVQVLLNLLDNARRHTPAGGSITIGASLSGQKQPPRVLKVWISDTGSGIATDDLPFIFERFYRADRARTGSERSSGLGLSIVKAIITAHGGEAHAESKLGEGTRIIFTLPLAQTPPAAGQPQSQSIKTLQQ
ncbi:MAG TPA: HAMP domain-containing sensor histidine kinase [Ktedonosporobacter sp.]|nr:HAMP domain-containing sensor histidine kinase [Ktedonosporobacter sp.]